MKNRPCIFQGVDEKGKPATIKPAVNCDKKCSCCGWNPEEQARRLKEGHFVKDADVIIKHYSGESDTRGTPLVYKNLRQLRFSARPADGST